MRNVATIGAAVVGLVLTPGVAGSSDAVGTEPGSAEVTAAQVEISLAGGEGQVTAGRKTTYTITARGAGSHPVPVILRASVPTRMGEVTTHDGGELREGLVNWPVTLAPDAPTTVRLTGVYRDPAAQDEGPVRVAFTACAVDPEDGRPVACATEIAELTQSSPVRWLGGIGAATGAVATVLLLRRRRSRPSADH